MDFFLYLIILTVLTLYNVFVDFIIYSLSERQWTNVQFMGLYPAERDIRVAVDDNNNMIFEHPPARRRRFLLTAELLIYSGVYTFFSMSVPYFIWIMMLVRYVVVIFEVCKNIVISGNGRVQMAFKILTHITTVFTFGYYVIDKINLVLPRRFKIKKSKQSAATYSIATVSIVGIGFFYMCKRLFVKKQNPQANSKDTRGQQMVNLGMMIIAFIGWSDFGQWKKFQDWIRATELVNNIFGDAGVDTTCSNFNEKKFLKYCKGKTKGPHLCLGCAAMSIPNMPELKSRITLNYSQESISENPGEYFYPLVNYLLKNEKRIPEWYERLPNHLKEQIFDSHYQIISKNNSYPVSCRLNYHKLQNGDYQFKRDESLDGGKWIIIATKDVSGKPIRVVNAQYNSDSDSEDYSVSQSVNKKPVVNLGGDMDYFEDLANVKPQSGADDAKKDVQEIRATIQEMKSDALAEAFSTEEPVSDDNEVIPYLRNLPSYFTPCLFICSMCLILYGTFYWHRKQLQKVREQESRLAVARAMAEQEVRMKLLKESSSVLAPASQPPVLNQIQVPSPEASGDRPEGGGDFRQHRRDNKEHRYDRHAGKTMSQRLKDARDAQIDPRFKQWKEVKQRSYFCYDINDLHKMIEERGLPMMNSIGEIITANTYALYRELLQKKYTPDPRVMDTIAKGSLDLRKLRDEESLDFLPFHKVVMHEPLSQHAYQFITDLIPTPDEDVKDLKSYIIPDWQFEESWKHYRWNPTTRRYEYYEDLLVEEVDDSKQQPESGGNIQLLARTVAEIEQEEMELSKPFTCTPEQYKKNSELIQDIINVQGNSALAVKHKEILDQSIVAKPESNISTVESMVCPWADKCTTKNCPKIHPSVRPESLNGLVPIPHYSHLQKVDTNNSYGIYNMSFSATERWGTCVFTKGGFLTDYHILFDDPLEKTKRIPDEDFSVYVDGKYHPIEFVERVPDIYGLDSKRLPEIYQDQIRFKVKDHFNVTQNLKQAKAREAKEGDTAYIVVVLPMEDGVKRTKTELVELKSIKGSPLLVYEAHTYNGDSGSPLYESGTGNLLGTHFGDIGGGFCALIPINRHNIPSINGGQKFELSKKFQPTL